MEGKREEGQATLILKKKEKACLKNSWFLKIFPHSCLLILKLFLRHGLGVLLRLTVNSESCPSPQVLELQTC